MNLSLHAENCFLSPSKPPKTVFAAFKSDSQNFMLVKFFNQISVSWLVGPGLDSIPPINSRSLATTDKDNWILWRCKAWGKPNRSRLELISLSNQQIYYILLLYPNVQMHKCTFTVVPKLLTFSQLLPINLPPPGRVCAKKNQIPKRRGGWLQFSRNA